jgi:hypothetical protein
LKPEQQTSNYLSFQFHPLCHVRDSCEFGTKSDDFANDSIYPARFEGGDFRDHVKKQSASCPIAGN